MYSTFQELYTEILTQLKDTSDTIDAVELDSIKLRINAIQDWITFHKNWDWRQKAFYFTMRTPYATGTIALTQNSRTVTVTDGTFDRTMRRGWLIYGNKAYKLQGYTSSSVLTLEAPYPGASVSGVAYKIVFPEYILNHEITNIGAVKVSGREIEFKHRNSLTEQIAGVGEPKQAAWGRRTTEDYFNTGTVAVTNGSTTVTLTGDEDWPTDVEGMPFRVNDFSKLYTIKTRTSASQIELEEAYEGTTGSGKSFAVAPKGSQTIIFRCSPNDYYSVELETLVRAPKMVSATAYSMIPDHAPLLHGAIWLALADFENKNPVRIQQARADFEKSLKQLEMTYSASPNLKWQSNDEGAARKSGTSNFNPLRDNL